MSSSSVATPDQSIDVEVQTLSAISSLLADLPQDSQARIATWISSRYGPPQASVFGAIKHGEPLPMHDAAGQFTDVASLFVAVNPSTGPEKALTVAFWLQECLHQEEWEGFAINTELKHLGHGLKNVTDALNALIEQRPQLVVQLRKSGKTKQARKHYKLTAEGIRKLRQMASAVNGV